MKMKMYEVLEFQKLYEKIKDSKMPFKTAYKFSKLIKALEVEIQFYQEKFGELVEKFAERDEEGGFIFLDEGQGVKIKKEDIQECNQQMADLNNLEVDIDVEEFSIDELEQIDLTIEDMRVLLPYIKED